MIRWNQARQTFNCQASYANDLALGLAAQFGPGTLGIIAYRV